MEFWPGKGREEVKAAFSQLTPKTEENKITYRDSDPIPSPARCAVIGCYPWTFGPRISCTYIFKFENEIVVKATQEGRCRTRTEGPQSELKVKETKEDPQLNQQ